jgi:hypothetical protein
MGKIMIHDGPAYAGSSVPGAPTIAPPVLLRMLSQLGLDSVRCCLEQYLLQYFKSHIMKMLTTKQAAMLLL